MINFINTLLYGDVKHIFLGLFLFSFLWTGINVLCRLFFYGLDLNEIIYCLISHISFEDYVKDQQKK